jgi:hypothetical protein
MRKEADELARLFASLTLGYLVLTAGEVFAFARLVAAVKAR